MEIISYKDFSALRLADYTSKRENITYLENWEFWGAIWLGESIRFSEWLRLEVMPEQTRSIAVHFRDFSENEILTILNSLKLTFLLDIKSNELEKLFGETPVISSYSPNRYTYELVFGEMEKYYLSCTFDSDKLDYLVLMNHPNPINSLKSFVNKQ